MSAKSDPFHRNRLYQLLADDRSYSLEGLEQLHDLLHEQPELAEITHPQKGSYFHLVCQHANDQENIAFRMVYALSNAGADPNAVNGKGNTPLHELIIQDSTDLDLIQSLFRVGVDPCLLNRKNNRADAYLIDHPQLLALCRGYGQGIWAAIEASDVQETERLIQGFIKVDCKHNSNKSLLDKARDRDCPPLLDVLANYQVTIEFVHSVLACDWQRAELIYQYQHPFLTINAFDSIHRLTWLRTIHRTCSESLLEICLDTHSPRPWAILFDSPSMKIDVNALCTDGLPLFFHCFDQHLTKSARTYMLMNANMYTKSSRGEIFLFHLVHLYSEQENDDYLRLFRTILYLHPLLLCQRDEHDRTLIEEIQLTSPTIHPRLQTFYQTIFNLLMRQLTDKVVMEQFVLNHFGYHLLMMLRNKHLPMSRDVYQLVCAMKSNRGLPLLITELNQAIATDDFIKFESIFKKKPNIYHARDWSGRTCAHLAVLHHRHDVLRFICDNYPGVINARDNLHRTSFHYACIINDQVSIDILELTDAKPMLDCMNLSPREYLEHRDTCSEEFRANDFPTGELQRRSAGISDFLKISFYPSLRKVVEKDAIDEVKLIHGEMIQMGFHLKDFHPHSCRHDYSHGQRYVPLIFVALQHRSLACIRYLIEVGLPVIGRMYITEPEMREMFKSIPQRPNDEAAEEPEYLDMVDLLQYLDEDVEVKTALGQQVVPPAAVPVIHPVPPTASEAKSSKNKQRWKNLFKKNQDNSNTKLPNCIIN